MSSVRASNENQAKNAAESRRSDFVDYSSMLLAHDERLASQGQRIAGVENELHSLNNRMAEDFSAMGSKIDSLMQAVTGITARPQYEVGKILGLVLTCAALLSLAAGAIIFIAGGQFDTQLEKMRGRVSVLETHQLYMRRGIFLDNLNVRATQ